MFSRFLSTILILICAQNAFSASEFISSVQTPDDSAAYAAGSHEVSIPTDAHHSDNDASDSCHQCHLGHCTFLVAPVLSLNSPFFMVSSYFLRNFSYTDVRPLGLDRPPRHTLA